MFDYAEAEFAHWDGGLPEGTHELLAHRHQFGELSMTIIVHGAGDQKQAAFELLARPDWFCVFDDERQQTGLIGAVAKAGLGPGMFEIVNSSLITTLQQSEPLFIVGDKKVRHWVLLGVESCCHIVASDEPKLRRIY